MLWILEAGLSFQKYETKIDIVTRDSTDRFSW